jgi:hypothetical protein
MKTLKVVFAAMMILLVSCNKQARTDLASIPEQTVKFVKNADLKKELTSAEHDFVMKHAEEVKAKILAEKRKNPPVALQDGTPILVTLINNGDGSFTWVYAALAPGDLIIWNFFRWGTELSITSGNVIPLASVSYYYPNTAVTTYSPPVDGTFWKQVVTVTGDFSLDANGVVGTGWAVSYSNVVQ